MFLELDSLFSILLFCILIWGEKILKGVSVSSDESFVYFCKAKALALQDADLFLV